MPCDYTIDVERRLVRTRAWGVLTEEELLGHQARLLADPHFDRTFSQIIDGVDVTSLTGVSNKMIKEGARQTLFAPGAKRAIVVSGAAAYGIGRMFQAYRALAGGQELIRIFRQRDEALAWLGEPRPPE